jgi:hypothetical protein
LIISANPSLTAVEVESIMKSTCKDMGAAGFDTLTGWGALDADGAVREAVRKAVNGGDMGVLLSAWGPCP